MNSSTVLFKGFAKTIYCFFNFKIALSIENVLVAAFGITTIN